MVYQTFENVSVVRLDPNEEIITALTDFCIREEIYGGLISGIGIVRSAVTGVYDNNLGHVKNEIQCTAEIMALNGNISMLDNRPHIHSHIVLAVSGGTLIGGHLFEAVIDQTAEIFIQRLPENSRLYRNSGTGFLFEAESE